MDTEKLTKSMIDLQKSTLDFMVDTLANIQDQSEKATKAYFEQMFALPRQGMQTMDAWMQEIRQTRTDFKSVIKDGLDEWGNLFEQTTKTAKQSVTPPKPQKTA